MTKSSHYMTESNPASIKQCTFSPMNMLKNLVKILKTNQTKFSFTLCNKGKDNLALNHLKKKPTQSIYVINKVNHLAIFNFIKIL